MEEKKVTVVIPSYNRADKIEKSVLSVLNQSYKNFEIIIVDDGSTDNTEEVIRFMQQKYGKIRYIKVKNGGANRARNIGIQSADEGTYAIAFHDSDDEWRPSKLENTMKAMEEHRVSVVFSSIMIHYVTRGTSKVVPQGWTKDSVKTRLLYENIISTPSLVVKKEVFNEIGVFNEKLRRFQDWDLVSRISQQYEIHYLPKVLVDQYQYGDNISMNNEAAIETLNYFEIQNEEIFKKHLREKAMFYFTCSVVREGKEKKAYLRKCFFTYPPIVIDFVKRLFFRGKEYTPRGNE